MVDFFFEKSSTQDAIGQNTQNLERKYIPDKNAKFLKNHRTIQILLNNNSQKLFPAKYFVCQN